MKNLKQSGLSLYAHLIRWETKDEMNFLKGLGGWRSFGCRTIDLERRRMLLLGYKQGMALRSNWAGLDKDQIAQYVKSCLEGETK